MRAEGPRLVLRVHLVERGHPDDLDEAAERQRLDPVLGLAPPGGPDGRPEADEVSGHLHAELLRRHEVPGLVQHHRKKQGDDEDDPADQVHPPSFPQELSSRARRRAQSSTTSTSATVVTAVRAASCSETIRATVSTMRGKLIRPAWKSATHASFAALYTAGAVPPAAAASRASATAGKAASSSGSNVQVAAVDQSRPRAAPGTRSGQAMPSEIGSRMSGGDAWMIVAPSENSTIECTIDCGCTTTSTRSSENPNSRCASITSRPLFTSVAELIVISGPMFQVGWASAWRGVTVSSRSRLQPRNGPPLAVSTSLRTSELLPARRHWAIVECSESTGTICPGLALLVTSAPPMISDSLFASARVRPASRAASVACSPAAPVTPLSTTSHGHPATSHTASGPARSTGISGRGERGDGGERGWPPDRGRCAGVVPRSVRPTSKWCRSAACACGAAAGLATATAATPNSAACLASASGSEPPAARATTRKRSGLRLMMSSA